MNLQPPSPANGDRSWRFQIELRAEAGAVPAVLWAIFPEDPRPRFREALARLEPYLRQGAPGSRAAALATTWDHLFGAIPGNHVHLLTPSPDHVILIKSDGAGGRKWVVTRAIRRGGQAYGWCVPFDAVPGAERLEMVTLAEWNLSNLLDLRQPPWSH